MSLLFFKLLNFFFYVDGDSFNSFTTSIMCKTFNLLSSVFQSINLCLVPSQKFYNYIRYKIKKKFFLPHYLYHNFFKHCSTVFFFFNKHSWSKFMAGIDSCFLYFSLHFEFVQTIVRTWFCFIVFLMALNIPVQWRKQNYIF